MAPRCRGLWRDVLRVALLLALIGVAELLKDVRLVIPKTVERYKDAVLRCVYDMEGDVLYQIKWYKGQNEFFRYTPGEKTPEKVFALKGVNVTKELSDSRQVTLHRVDLETEGRYACEVSADAPSFATQLIEDRLIVVEVPRYPPNIAGLQSRYKLGDYLRANCTTEPSHPPANLTIYINGQQYVPRERVRDYRMKETDQGRRSSRIGIEIQLRPEHFGPDNKLKIRCLGTVYDLYSKVDERSVELRSAWMPPPSVLETNQPPHGAPYDQDVHVVPDNKRQRHPPDPPNGAPASRGPAAVVLLLAALTVR